MSKRAERLGECPAKLAGETMGRSSCKKRSCPVCGVRWARDWRKSMEENLRQLRRPLVLISITAPGADVLPWDEHHCRHRRPHKHSGKTGCRVQQQDARWWSEMATWRWSKLRKAAAIATERATGLAPVIVERVWEPQKRGVPHLHLVLPYGTPDEIDVAHRFAAELKARAVEYGFGFVDAKADPDALHGVRLRPIMAEECARYLASYLTGRSAKKNSIRQNISDPNMPRSLVWLTPKITSKEVAITATRRPTWVTMRTIRRARHMYAFARGICDPPVWQDMFEAAKVALVCRRLFGARSHTGDDGGDPEVEQVLAAARSLQRRIGRGWKSQAYEMPRFGWERPATAFGRQLSEFWLGVAGLQLETAKAA